ncbi:glycosyltransferase family 4 protein [Epibacterium ulvae]|uniref:glycosyltransferase family 4 protein n=1 Tax=Epibacterium ulvae TaxID=1156985 RepID=UPI0024930D92|nr:glycosyltransferase family 4 protein [Epibacterium ulvae]
MIFQRVAFAVPGDLTTKTGGYIYDRRLIDELRVLGLEVDHIALPDGFPNPTSEQMAEAFAQLCAIALDCPVIIDGLAFGALDPERVAQIKAPIVALVHHPLAKESGLASDLARAFHDTERRNLAQVQHVLVPSRHTAEILINEYAIAADQIAIAAPGLDHPCDPPQPQDPPLILSVGIQLPRKGHDTLLRALAQITDLNWQAVIVGAPLDAAYAQDLQALRSALGLEERVNFTGLIERSDLELYYRQASLFALATRYEGYGMVFDEALINGLPIVSCDAGAVPDTVPQDAGFLVPPDRPEAFAEALRRLLTQPELREELHKAAQDHGLRRQLWAETAQTVEAALQPVFALAQSQKRAAI